MLEMIEKLEKNRNEVNERIEKMQVRLIDEFYEKKNRSNLA